ncbi:MAG: restriction endonuclease subunit S, partial [Methanosarcina sp.]|nr:restriction endonuclease subunit S [Methanosarcina sp.]
AGLIFNAGNIYPEYVWRWALSEYEKTRSGGRGGAQPALNGNKVRELLIPIPPLNEQKRIVEKVEQFMGLCDELEAKLRKSREDCEKLLEAVMKGLLEGAAAEI